jgi:hypothetical protein
MQLTNEELRALSGSDAERGWLQIPSSCPPEMRHAICEKRVAMLQSKRSKSTQAADTAKRRKLAEKLLQEINAQADAESEATLRLRAQAINLFL